MSDLLPVDDTPWPPPSVANRYARMRLPEAWYSGDPSQLRTAYGTKVTTSQPGRGVTTTLNPGGGPARVQAASRDTFWSTEQTRELDTRRHLPIAQDITTMSADLLFSDPPSFIVDGPRDAKGAPLPATLAAQQRLDYVLRKCKFQATLLAAAEISSALGSTGLRIAFDKAGPVKDRPLVTRVDADAIVPHYSWGQLIAVTFWQVVSADATYDVVWRHLELHQDGVVYHALYKGDGRNLGKRRPLAEQPATAHLAVGEDSGIRIVSTGKTGTSIPNMLPDPAERSSYGGRSDLTLPVMDILDAADKAYTQLMDDVDDSKSRLLIADSMLERGRPGEGVTFDANQRVFNRVKVPPAEKEGGGLPIEKVQFEMRVEQYLQLIDALTHKAIDAAGYSAQTDREQTGDAMTATEVNTRSRKSMGTRDKKVRYWEDELEELLTTLLRVDVEQFSPTEQVEGASVRVEAFPVLVQFPEAVQPTLIELANTAKVLSEAKAASMEVLVALVHPDWDTVEVTEEVDRIKAATDVIDPVSFGTGGQGMGPGDGI